MKICWTYKSFQELRRLEPVQRRAALRARCLPRRNWQTWTAFFWAGTIFVGGLLGSVMEVANARASGGTAPEVSIAWPLSGSGFPLGDLIKIKASASEPDGSIDHVQFFADTNIIGAVSNAPFNIIWQVSTTPSTPPFSGRPVNLTAVAVDGLGVSTQSAPVSIGYCSGCPPRHYVAITTLPDGTLFSAPATFTFRAELLATISPSDNGPIQFFVGTNSLGIVTQSGPFTATSPPFSITVTNLAEGQYPLSIKCLGINAGAETVSQPITINVTRLGLQSPLVTSDNRFAFDVVTSFPGNPTVIQASSNLLDWFPVNTNVPSSNTLLFVESSAATNSARFYRAIVFPK